MIIGIIRGTMLEESCCLTPLCCRTFHATNEAGIMIVGLFVSPIIVVAITLAKSSMAGQLGNDAVERQHPVIAMWGMSSHACW